MALLIRNHFRYDPQFRLAILMGVPITVVLLVVTVFINKARIVDPFSAEGGAVFASTFPLYLAIFLFPSTVKTALTYSSQAEASWILVASPADRTRLLIAARRFTGLFFLAPYLLALCVVFLVLTGSIAHTLQHFAMIATLLLAETDVLLFLLPALPFSRKSTVGAAGVQMLLPLLPAVAALLVLFLLLSFAYRSPYLYWPVLGGLLALDAALRAWGPRYAAVRLADKEMEI